VTYEGHLTYARRRGCGVTCAAAASAYGEEFTTYVPVTFDPVLLPTRLANTPAPSTKVQKAYLSLSISSHTCVYGQPPLPQVQRTKERPRRRQRALFYLPKKAPRGTTSAEERRNAEVQC